MGGSVLDGPEGRRRGDSGLWPCPRPDMRIERPRRYKRDLGQNKWPLRTLIGSIRGPAAANIRGVRGVVRPRVPTRPRPRTDACRSPETREPEPDLGRPRLVEGGQACPRGGRYPPRSAGMRCRPRGPRWASGSPPGCGSRSHERAGDGQDHPRQDRTLIRWFGGVAWPAAISVASSWTWECDRYPMCARGGRARSRAPNPSLFEEVPVQGRLSCDQRSSRSSSSR